MPVPYMNPYFQNNPTYAQPQYGQVNPYPDRLAQLQAQQQQFNQSQYGQQIPVQQIGLHGEVVDSIDVVKAKNVDMSGNVTYYPKADLSEIFTKQLMPDGTSRIVTYKAAMPEVPQQTQQQTVNLESLNAMLGQLKMDILQGIGGELENIKQMIPSTSSNPEPPAKRGGTSK